MKVFIFLLLSISIVFAVEQDPLIMRAQASVFPKIILLDKEVSSKITDNTITLSIVHNTQETKAAKKLKKLIDKEYKEKIGTYNFEIKMINSDRFDNFYNSTSYYLFNVNDKEKKKIVSYAKKNKKVCFGYSYRDFGSDILISLSVKEKTYIYLNRSSLQEYNINFIPILYKIVRIK